MDSKGVMKGRPYSDPKTRKDIVSTSERVPSDAGAFPVPVWRGDRRSSSKVESGRRDSSGYSVIH